MIGISKVVDFDVADVLRRSPVAEMPNAREVMDECLHRSFNVWIGTVDSEVACAWGLIYPTLLSTTPYMWLLTTDIVAEHKFLFIRWSQRYVEGLLKDFDEIIGDVIEPNVAAKKWLKWLGAEFSYTEMGRTPFVIRRKHG